MKEISIVGGGPVGSYAAFLLARNFDVEVYEEHKKIGEPLQCAGLVSSELKGIIKNDEFVINKIDCARVYSKKKHIDVKLRPNYVIDRTKFDCALYEKALDNGARFHLGKRLDENDIRKIKSDYIIGADGPSSKVASCFGMLNKREYFIGMQARVKIKNENIIEFYPFVKDFAWLIPENENIARIGIAARSNAKETFDNFLKRYKCRVIDKQAGLIPLYSPKQEIQKNNVFLVGDASGFLKATTGGGIIQGLIASQLLAKAIIYKKDYGELCEGLKKEMHYHLMIRKIIDCLSEKDSEYLIELCGQSKVKKVLHDIEREHSSKLVFSLLLREPRFLYFTKYLNKIFINKQTFKADKWVI